MIGRRASDESGFVTAFVTAGALMFLIVAGFVVDVGGFMNAKRLAVNEAEAAALAGASALASPTLRGGAVALDPEAARAAAGAYLARTGHAGEVAVAGDVVEVTVSFPKRTFVLGVAGLWERTVHGRASARAVRGVDKPEA